MPMQLKKSTVFTWSKVAGNQGPVSTSSTPAAVTHCPVKHNATINNKPFKTFSINETISVVVMGHGCFGEYTK